MHHTRARQATRPLRATLTLKPLKHPYDFIYLLYANRPLTPPNTPPLIDPWFTPQKLNMRNPTHTYTPAGPLLQTSEPTISPRVSRKFSISPPTATVRLCNGLRSSESLVTPQWFAARLLLLLLSLIILHRCSFCASMLQVVRGFSSCTSLFCIVNTTSLSLSSV